MTKSKKWEALSPKQMKAIKGGATDGPMPQTREHNYYGTDGPMPQTREESYGTDGPMPQN